MLQHGVLSMAHGSNKGGAEKILGRIKGVEYDKLVEEIQPQLAALKTYPMTKQIEKQIMAVCSPAPDYIMDW